MTQRKRTHINDYKAEVKLFASRALISFIGVIVLISVLIVNLFNIQINEFQNYKTRSNDNRIKIVPIAPNRGLIYDRNHKLLAENRPVFSLEVTPVQVPNLKETLIFTVLTMAFFYLTSNKEEKKEVFRDNYRKKDLETFGIFILFIYIVYHTGIQHI